MAPAVSTIVRYAVVLIFVVVTAALLALAFVVIHDRNERILRERVETLHLRALALTAGIEREVGDARLRAGAVPTAPLAAHWYAVDRDLAGIARLHAQYPDAVRDGVLSRLRADLESLRGTRLSAERLETRIDDLRLGVVQLSRLHATDALATLDEIEARHLRYERTVWYAAVPVLIVCAAILWHIVRLMRATLVRQAHIEKELRASRERTLQLQKLEALGELIGGVAHDFNNLMTAVTGNVQLLQMDDGLSDGTRRGLRQIDDAASRAIELTRQLRAFSKERTGRAEEFEAGTWLEQRRAVFARAAGADRLFDLRIDGTLPRVEADPAQLEAVIEAVIDNARAATAAGGRIELIASTVRSTAGHRLYDMLGDTDYLCVQVEDDGKGMDEDTLSRAFDPFFSTREHGDARGLGLSMAQGVIRAADGYLHIVSEPGAGTCVEMFLPAVRASAPGPAPAPADVAGGTETVLVVDDEPAICDVLEAGLGALGYRVLTAANAARALEYLGAPAESVDALITDIVMPGDSGLELAHKARAVQPALAIVLMSGYADKVFARSERAEQRFVLIDKPFDVDEVARVLRRELDARPVTA